MASAFLVAALLLLPFAWLPGPFWDGALYRELLPLGRDAFLQPYIDNGRPLGGWPHWLAIRFVGADHGPFLLSALAMAVTAAAAQALWSRHLSCGAGVAVALGLMTALSPAFASALGGTVTQFFSGFALLAGGILCFSIAGSRAGGRSVALQAAGGVLLLAGTLLSESGVALTPLAPLAFAHARSPDGGTRELLRLGARHGWICIVCMGALAAMFIRFPAAGIYAQAHDLNTGLLRLGASAASMAISLVVTQLLPIAALAFWWLRRQGQPPPHRHWLLAGLALLALGCAPYIAAGRLTSPFGWGSRMMLLTGAGTALIAWSLAQRWVAPRTFAIAMIVCTALGTAARWPFWAERQLLQDSLVQSAGRLVQPGQLTDLVLTAVPAMVAQPYRDFELTVLLRAATGRPDVTLRLQGGGREALETFLRAHGLPGAAARAPQCWQGAFLVQRDPGWWLAAIGHPWRRWRVGPRAALDAIPAADMPVLKGAASPC